VSNPRWDDVPQIVNDLAYETIGLGIGVHRDIGPGLIEKPYQLLLAERLKAAGHHVEFERRLPLVVSGTTLDRAYSADIVVDEVLLVETKAVKTIDFGMIARTKTSLRIGNYSLGVILNFHTPLLTIKRVVPDGFGISGFREAPQGAADEHSA
jgi:GxxExxY protein